jgi:hypothetical protein
MRFRALPDGRNAHPVSVRTGEEPPSGFRALPDGRNARPVSVRTALMPSTKL